MDAADLRVFEAVARLGGMSRAAQELNTVQSNVTARIRLLEEQLAAPLFERHSRGVALTPAGRRLMPYALQVISLLNDARRGKVYAALYGPQGRKGDLLLAPLDDVLERVHGSTLFVGDALGVYRKNIEEAYQKYADKKNTIVKG